MWLKLNGFFPLLFVIIRVSPGTALLVQWLRLRASIADAAQAAAEKKKKKEEFAAGAEAAISDSCRNLQPKCLWGLAGSKMREAMCKKNYVPIIFCLSLSYF